MIFLRLFPPCGLEFRSESCMFDLVSTMSTVYLRRISWRAVIRTLIGLDSGVIIPTSTISIFACLSSYSFDGGPIG